MPKLITPEEREWRNQTLTDTFASWELDGLRMSEMDYKWARKYINGEVTLEEGRKNAIQHYLTLRDREK